MVFDSQLLADIPECIIVKLLSIIKDEDSKDSEVANDAFPDEVLDIFLSDSSQGFYLNPFSEVVNPYDEELELLYRHKEGSHYVEPPLSKWPGSIHRGELL